MKLFLFFIFQVVGFIQASSNTKALFDALCVQCDLNAEQGNKIFINFRVFTSTLETTFQKAWDKSPKHRELLRELDPPHVWTILTRMEGALLSQLKTVRRIVHDFGHVLSRTKGCLEWLDKLLGERTDIFTGSYLDLLLKSLSASKNIQIAELSTKRLLLVLTEFRRMHLEREHLFISKNEELHDIYAHYVFLYVFLINRPLGTAVKESIKHDTFPVVVKLLAKTDVPEGMDTKLLNKYLTPDDFVRYGGRLHLRTTKNFFFVYRTWLRIMAKMPSQRIRRLYFDERKELALNVEDFEWKIDDFYKEKNDQLAVAKWDQQDLLNIAIMFDFIDSLVAFERLRINMTKLKHRVVEILRIYHGI